MPLGANTSFNRASTPKLSPFTNVPWKSVQRPSDHIGPQSQLGSITSPDCWSFRSAVEVVRAHDFSQGKYNEKALFERAIEIDEKTLGSEHPDLATRLSNLAGLLKSQVDC